MICRVCLLDSTEYVRIFDNEGAALEIASIIFKHLWIEPKIDDPISDIICNTCWQKLYSFHIFYDSVADAQRKLSEGIWVRENPYIKKEYCEDAPMETTVANEANRSFIKSEPDYFDNENDPQDTSVPFNMECMKYEEHMPIEKPLIDEKTVAAAEEGYWSRNKPFQCTQCSAAFCRKPYLEIHMRTHTGERPFQCDICLKRFTQKSTLNIHRRTHSVQNKPFQCEQCVAKFARKTYLDIHMRTHTGERPFECDVCLKRFTQKSSLNIHKTVHTVRIRPFQCALCSATFCRKLYHDIHQRTHTGERPFKCEICSKKFSQRSTLNIHKKIHTASPDLRTTSKDLGTTFKDLGTTSKDLESTAKDLGKTAEYLERTDKDSEATSTDLNSISQD